jgi:hypothetical protein
MLASSSRGDWSADATGPRGLHQRRRCSSTAPEAGAARHRPGASRLGRTWSPRAHAWPGRSLHRHSKHARCATGVQHCGRSCFPISKISRHSNGEDICAIRYTGRTHLIGIVQHAGSAKPRSMQAALVRALAALSIRRRLRLPVHINGGRTHGSHALNLRVRSKRPCSAASVGLTNRGQAS